VADVRVSVRDIAGVIGRRGNVPVLANSPEEAADHFGWFAHPPPTTSGLSEESAPGTLAKFGL
jgi:hypothetical protein